MSLGENLQYLRSEKNWTQEELAERLEVSRQTISKWESGGAFPEMEKLLLLCDLFDTNMDTLLRGNVQQVFEHKTANYEEHYNKYIWQIVIGTTGILFGVAVLLFFFGMTDSGLSIIPFFFFLMVSIGLFVVAGLSHDQFQQDNPVIHWQFPEEQIATFRRRYPTMIAGATLLILLDVFLLVIPFLVFDLSDKAVFLLAAGFMFLLTIAVGVFVYAGMQKEKFEIEQYNQEASPEVALKERRSSQISSVIMLSATVVFLLLGFLKNAWHPAWVVFPVGGILCGIVNIVLGVEQ